MTFISASPTDPSVQLGLERKVSGYGNSISGQKYQGSSSSAPKKKPLPAPSRPSAVKRSNSSPAAAPPSNMKRIGPTSSTPIGAKKYPGGAAKAAGKPASKALGNGLGAATAAGKPASKALGNGFGAGKSALGSAGNKAASTTSLANNKINNINKNVPKPYSSTAGSSYPAEKKTAVKPGAPKPFTPPAPSSNNNSKKDVSPYPGTNTKPGEGGRKPVRRRFKPMERAAPQTEHGKMQHIAV
jgi:hypothetical protein